MREMKFAEASTRLDRIAEGLETAPDCVVMFKAAKALRTAKHQCIESGDGHILAQDADRTEKIKEHFCRQFSPETADSRQDQLLTDSVVKIMI